MPRPSKYLSQTTLSIIGEMSGDNTVSVNDCKRWTTTLVFPVHPGTGNFRAHIRIKKRQYDRNNFTEPWVLVEDEQYLKEVEIRRELSKKGKDPAEITRAVELTWDVLRLHLWTPVLNKESYHLEQIKALKRLLRKPDTVGRERFFFDGVTRRTNIIHEITNDEAQSLYEILNQIVFRHESSVVNYTIDNFW